MAECPDCVNHPGTPSTGTCVGCQMPYCDECLVTTPDGRKFCRSCAKTGAGVRKQQNPGGLAITSIVLSGIGFICCLTAIPGMVIGYVELNSIKKGKSPAEGKPLALTGAIIGTILTAIILLMFLIFIVSLIVHW